jgi:PKD domain
MRHRWPAAVAVCAAAVLSAPRAYADGPAVDVYVDGAPAQRFDVQQLGAYDATGSDSTGWSIEHIVGLAGATPKAAEVMGDHPTMYALGGDDFAGPNDFAGGAAPVIWNNGASMQSMRPARNDGDSASGTIVSGVISIFAHTGGPSEMSASAVGDTHVAGRPVTLNVSGACAGGTVDWHFGDGTTGTGASVTHTYATRDTFYAFADVECGNGVGGAAVVQVGVQGPGTGPGAGSTPTPTPTPAATAPAKPTATPKPHKPAKTPTPTPTARAGGGTGKGTGGGGKPAATATAAPSPGVVPTVAPAPTSVPSQATPAPATPPAASPSSPAPRVSATPQRTATPTPRSNLPVVKGRLISAVVPVPPATLAAPAPATAAERTGGVTLKPAPKLALPLGLLAVAALALAGAWRERRTL